MEGGAKIVGVFRVKNHDFTPKNNIFSNCGGRLENFWGISCEKSRFYAKKSYFFQFFHWIRPGVQASGATLVIAGVWGIPSEYRLSLFLLTGVDGPCLCWVRTFALCINLYLDLVPHVQLTD